MQRAKETRTGALCSELRPHIHRAGSACNLMTRTIITATSSQGAGPEGEDAVSVEEVRGTLPLPLPSLDHVADGHLPRTTTALSRADAVAVAVHALGGTCAGTRRYLRGGGRSGGASAA